MNISRRDGCRSASWARPSPATGCRRATSAPSDRLCPETCPERVGIPLVLVAQRVVARPQLVRGGEALHRHPGHDADTVEFGGIELAVLDRAVDAAAGR